MKLYHNWPFALNRLMDIVDGYFLHPLFGYRRVNYRGLPGHLALIARDLLVKEPAGNPDEWVI
jgi:hypothetical protein